MSETDILKFQRDNRFNNFIKRYYEINENESDLYNEMIIRRDPFPLKFELRLTFNSIFALKATSYL
jgi:hypothetical protein